MPFSFTGQGWCLHCSYQHGIGYRYLQRISQAIQRSILESWCGQLSLRKARSKTQGCELLINMEYTHTFLSLSELISIFMLYFIENGDSLFQRMGVKYNLS